MEPYRQDIGKIYLVFALSLALLAASFYWLGFKPLVQRLRLEHTHEISHFLDTGEWLLEGVLARYRDLARQSASRTAIRKRQAAYLQGKVSREALVAFSAPKLADAMEANKALVGISRFAPDGQLLFGVGEQLPPALLRDCAGSQLSGLRMQGPIQVGAAHRLLICSPIIDRDAGHVGADLLVFDDGDIQRVIDVPQPGLGSFAVVRHGRIIYWPRQLEDTAARGVLDAFLTSGVTDPGYILASAPLSDSDWRLVAVVNKAQFFAAIERQRLLLLGVVAVVAVAVMLLTMLTLRPVVRTLLLEQRLFELSHRDGLTGLYNHAYLQELLDRELERARRHGRALSVLMLDIDHFKEVNDRYGHPVGDTVLARVGEVLAGSLRTIDLPARYGGEEFMVLLPDTGSDSARTLAERLRTIMAGEFVPTPGGAVSITVSIGVVTCEPRRAACDRQRLVRQADRAMYASKEAGRDRVTAVLLEEDDD